VLKKTLTRTWRTAAIVVPVVLTAGAAVIAGTGVASASPQPGSVSAVGGTIYVAAGTGAINNVVIRNVGGGGFEIEDVNNDLTIGNPSGGCTSFTDSRVRCPGTNTKLHITLLDGNDVFTADGVHLSSTVYGSDGDDTINGSESNDALFGGYGNDTFFADAGNDSVVADAGDDLLEGGADDDNLKGFDGEDILRGNAGNDTLNGLNGDDTLDGGSGDDILKGSYGNDDLQGGPGSDSMNGDWGDDTTRGGAGNDILKGDDGNVYGDAGDDRLFPGGGGADFFGGTGVDTADYSGWDGVNVSLDDSKNDGGFPCDDFIGCPVTTYDNVHIDIENVVGSKGGDKIVGNALNNSFDGGLGNDTLIGRSGDDYLDAEGGQNQKDDGGDGFDICVGFNVNRVACES
jgi:Ca2+-binding RTX toxin-like protein